MTHTYIVQKRVNNEWQQVAEHKIRALAVGYIVEDMSKKWDADPQDYKIAEKKVDEEAILTTVAGNIARLLEGYAFSITIRPFFSDGSGLIELHESKWNYPSITRAELEQVFKILDEANADLGDYEVLMSIANNCVIRLILSKKENK